MKSLDLSKYKIKVHEPFSYYLCGEEPEHTFTIHLLDVVRFSGHACPSIVGAFLLAQRVTQELYPQTTQVLRGDIQIQFANPLEQGATGPIANVFSYIFGAWGDSGFAGLKGEFRRRDLVKFSCTQLPANSILFKSISQDKAVLLSYHPSRAQVPSNPDLTWQLQWREKINLILKQPESYIDVVSHKE